MDYIFGVLKQHRIIRLLVTSFASMAGMTVSGHPLTVAARGKKNDICGSVFDSEKAELYHIFRWK